VGQLVSALAILATKNEQRHILFVIKALINEGLDVVLLDDGSSDKTVEIANTMFGKGLLAIHSRPDTGIFDGTGILKWKKRVAKGYDHEWLVHVDADEWLQHPTPNRSLMSLIVEADSLGANAIDFEEFTFLPTKDLSLGEDPRKQFRHYYWHKPTGYGYLRAWKRSARLTNTRTGGHGLHSAFPWIPARVRVHKVKGILRHYPILGREHLQEKYQHRIFSSKEVDKGWHSDRLQLSNWNFNLSINSYVFSLECPEDKNFNLSKPTNLHFWYPDWANLE
jgi:glycosyltransferase involved in cell wall biosynthesis